MGQNNLGAVPLSNGLDTRPCKILDPRLLNALCRAISTKWRLYRDHRLRDVTSPHAYWRAYAQTDRRRTTDTGLQLAAWRSG